jgi:hypothetical protein
VQNTLNQHKIEAVVPKRQVVGIADEKLDRPISLICIRYSDRTSRRSTPIIDFGGARSQNRIV